MKVALYARVSTHDQTAENQLLELRRYVAARGWTGIEYVDQDVSDATDRRPALDQLVADVRRHRVQGVVCWRLDRLGRNLSHLVLLLDEWQSRGRQDGWSRAYSARLRSSSGRGCKSVFVRDSLGQGARDTPRSPTIVGRAESGHLRRAVPRDGGDKARRLSREHQTLAPRAGSAACR